MLPRPLGQGKLFYQNISPANMEESSANRIVRQTFQNPFDKESFVYFIKSLLNHIESAPFIYRGNFIPDAYEPYIKTLERIGKYQDKDDKKIDLLIVRLKKETSLERARTMQRNFIAWYLNGSRGDVLKDAALVAFVSPNSDDWRFSLVKMDYRLDASGEKIKIKQELTPARRFSFLVGKTESSHTAQSRLVPILQDDYRDPTLQDLEEAFSIEKVTKEFFEKYRGLFLKVKEALDEVVRKDTKVKQDFETKDIDTVNFAKKLLGQIVFLYFLQKKGWFGVERDKNWGTGPKNFLRLLFERGITKYANFFNEVLEPLFYEALAVERTDDFYSRFNCKIPFLNGGLFDPLNNYDWVHTDILLPNELFSNSTKTKKGDVGTGILDIFDRYNFTVKEDEPLEKEVAIDPEMLGKVFENLLEVKDRKSKGTYYTPREIVHYMCQQSLINYLATELKGKVKKEDIETLIKYGEIVVEHDSRVVQQGKETKTYSFKLPKNIRDNAKLIDEKLTSIRICDPAVGSGAFPVGMMNEVVRTRNALTNYIKGKKDRTIYDFKRHAIQNCLYGVDIDPGAVEIAKLRLWLSLIVDEEDIKQIKPLPNLDYKIVCGNSLLGVEKNLFNQKLFAELEKLKPLFFNETNTRKKQEYKNQIDELIVQITNGHKDFDFEVYFSEVFHEKKGFDVVIANPPYKFLSGKGSPIQELLKNGKRKEAKTLQEMINLMTQRFPDSSKGCKDYYKWFVELGSKIVKNNGVLTYITPNTFISLPKYQDIRMIIFERFTNIILIDFGFDIFEAPIVPSAVFISQKVSPQNNLVNYSDLKGIDRNSLKNNNIALIIEQNLIQVKLADKILTLYKHPLAEKIYLESKFTLKDFLRISEGEHSLKNDFSKIIKGEKIKSIPVIYDSRIQRYTPAKIVELPKTLCPNFNYDLHTGERFFIRKTGDEILAVPPETFDFAIAHQNLYVAKTKNEQLTTKLFLALLSSNLLNFLYQNGIYGQKKRTLAQFRIYALYLIPVPDLKKMNQKPFINLVDKILAITKDDDYPKNETKQKKVKEYEQKIDQLVYKLYGLTKEEIKIIENYD